MKKLLALLLVASCASEPVPMPGPPAPYRPFNDPGNVPHEERTSGYDVGHYRIEVKIDERDPKIEGTTTISLTAVAEVLDEIVLDAEDMKFSAVTVGEKAAAFKLRPGKLVVPVDPPAKKGDALVVSASYTGVPRHGLFRVAPDKGYPSKPWMVWTQGETEYHHHWFPCWDQPNDLATSEVIASVREPFRTVSNGALVSETGMDGWKRWHWKQEQPHAAYLVTLVAGDFEVQKEEMELGGRKLELSYYTAKGKHDAADVKRCFGRTAAMMKFFSEKTGVDYPWSKYAQVCVWDFIWGGMENTSATTLHGYTVVPARAAMDRDSDGLIAHELAHQWFGDLVTCRTWSETWLNEGFATYFGALWAEQAGGEDALAESMWGCAGAVLGAPYSRPIVTTCYSDPLDMFDQHSYQKGAWVLHMLRAMIGDDAWWKGINLHLKKNAHRNVRTQDLQEAMETASGRPLDWFFDEWCFKAGVPELEVSTSWDDAFKTLRIVIEQKQKVDDHVPVFKMPVEIEVDGRSFRAWIDRARNDIYLPMESRPSFVLIDPRGRLLKKLAHRLEPSELLAAAARSPHAWTRRWAVERLGESKGEAVIAALKRALLEDKAAMVQVAAAQALGKLDADALLAAVKIENARARWAVYEGLGNFAGRDEVAALLEKAGNEEASPNCRATAWTAYGKGGAKRFDALLKAAEKFMDDEWVLPGILSGMMESDAGRAVALLTSETTYGRHPWIRERAASLLGEVGRRLKAAAPADIRGRLAQLAGDPAFRIRNIATGQLKEVGTAAEAEVLEKQAATEFDGRLIKNMKAAARAIRERK
jgi:aminopeptidase N